MVKLSAHLVFKSKSMNKTVIFLLITVLTLSLFLLTKQ